jgi:hypothetical protein
MITLRPIVARPDGLRTPRIRALRDAGFGYGFLPWARGPEWELQEDHEFTVHTAKGLRHFRIPKGYRFNKASVPPIFWGFPFGYLPDGLCTVPSLEHDMLCDLLDGGSDWLRLRLPAEMLVPPMVHEVHLHFHDRLIAFGVRSTKALAMARAVMWFGPGTWIGNLLSKLT